VTAEEWLGVGELGIGFRRRNMNRFGEASRLGTSRWDVVGPGLVTSTEMAKCRSPFPLLIQDVEARSDTKSLDGPTLRFTEYFGTRDGVPVPVPVSSRRRRHFLVAKTVSWAKTVAGAVDRIRRNAGELQDEPIADLAMLHQIEFGAGYVFCSKSEWAQFGHDWLPAPSPTTISSCMD
jgi:hypothetical protein